MHDTISLPPELLPPYPDDLRAVFLYAGQAPIRKDISQRLARDTAWLAKCEVLLEDARVQGEMREELLACAERGRAWVAESEAELEALDATLAAQGLTFKALEEVCDEQ